MLAGQARWTAREPDELWHSGCTSQSKHRERMEGPSSTAKALRAGATPEIVVSRGAPVIEIGIKFVVQQPSRSSRAWRMVPRRYAMTFEIDEAGDLVQRYGCKPRPFYRLVAELVARNGNLAEFHQGVTDALDPAAAVPGDNHHADYRLRFSTGRDRRVMDEEIGARR